MSPPPSVTVLCTLELPAPFAELVTPHASVRALGRIPAAPELRAELRDRPVDVLCPQMMDRVDDDLLAAGGERLRAVCLYAAGHDNVDVEAATRRGIAVANTPGVLTAATADLAVALMLAVARRICEGDRLVRGGAFSGWEPDLLLGADMEGALLGVVGFGRIGHAVARRALGFSMRVAFARRESATVPADLAGRVAPMPLGRLLAEADAVSLHVPLTPQTRHLIGERELRAMRPGAILVNTARGPVVDEAALVRALDEGWIAGAGLDVYEDEPRLAPGLAECRNAVLAPHAGSATPRTRGAMSELCARNTLDALAGRVPGRCVNPSAWAAGGPPPPLPPGTASG